MYEKQGVTNAGRLSCKVRVVGNRAVVVPPAMVHFIQASACPARGGQLYYGVVEELDTAALPNGLKIRLTSVAVHKKGG